MRTLRWNGKTWYVDNRSLAKRIRRWFFWIGGWERANSAGWDFRRDDGSLRDPTPMSFFGHKITYFGGWLQVHLRGRYFVWNWRIPAHGPDPNGDGWARGKGYAYLSRNGTPSGAHYWLWGVERWGRCLQSSGPQ